MKHTDVYALKNGSWKFKLGTTTWLLFSLALIAWNWFISLTVIRWYSTGMPRDFILGDELSDLAWTKPGIYLTLFAFQVIAYVGLWHVSRLLLRRSTLRQRIRTALSRAASMLALINLIVWVTIPFV